MPTEGRRRRLKSGQVEAQRAGATALMVPQARCLSCGLEWLHAESGKVCRHLQLRCPGR